MQTIDIEMIKNLVSTANNPEQAVMQLAQNNPAMNLILHKVTNSKMSFKDFAMAYAKNNNIDIQPVLDMMSQMGIK